MKPRARLLAYVTVFLTALLIPAFYIWFYTFISRIANFTEGGSAFFVVLGAICGITTAVFAGMGILEFWIDNKESAFWKMYCWIKELQAEKDEIKAAELKELKRLADAKEFDSWLKIEK